MINPVIMFRIAAKIMLGRKRIEASRGERDWTFCQLKGTSISDFDTGKRRLWVCNLQKTAEQLHNLHYAIREEDHKTDCCEW